MMRAREFVKEKWSKKYKRSINCDRPRGFSQRAHCQGRASEAAQEPLQELDFLGSPCTRDCSGHRAGYQWYQRNQQLPITPSTSFNKGAILAKQGK